MNLTSIAEHSKWLGTKFEQSDMKWKLHCKRIVFGEQPLELWMFVPCKLVDGVWVVLEVPNLDSIYKEGHKERFEEYVQAKERCLFEFNSAFLSFDKSDMENNTVEDLLSDGYDYILTKTAQKQIGCDH